MVISSKKALQNRQMLLSIYHHTDKTNSFWEYYLIDLETSAITFPSYSLIASAT